MAFVNSTISPVIKANRGTGTLQYITGDVTVGGKFAIYGKWAPTLTGAGGALGSVIYNVYVYHPVTGVYIGRVPVYA